MILPVLLLSATVLFEALPAPAPISAASALRHTFKEAQTLEQGTASFQFRWTEPDERSHLQLLKLSGPHGDLLLLIPNHKLFGIILIYPGGDGGKTQMTVYRKQLDLWRQTPAATHRIAFTWSPEECRLYLDGRLCAVNPTNAPRAIVVEQLELGRPAMLYPESQRSGKRYEVWQFKLENRVVPQTELLDAIGQQPEDDF